MYADDVQSLMHGLPFDHIHLVEWINSVSQDIQFWMMTSRLNYNPSKRSVIWLGTRQQFQKLYHTLIALTVPNFTFSSRVRDVDVTLDSELFVTWVPHLTVN